jgi:hypothetical protein
MNGVSYLEKLLDGAAVEWKASGALGELVRGNGLQNNHGQLLGYGRGIRTAGLFANC